jgi:hypothetical protein
MECKEGIRENIMNIMNIMNILLYCIFIIFEFYSCKDKHDNAQNTFTICGDETYWTSF